MKRAGTHRYSNRERSWQHLGRKKFLDRVKLASRHHMLGCQFPVNTDMHFVKMLKCHLKKTIHSQQKSSILQVCTIRDSFSRKRPYIQRFPFSRLVTEGAFQVQESYLFFFLRTQLSRIASKFNSISQRLEVLQTLCQTITLTPSGNNVQGKKNSYLSLKNNQVKKIFCCGQKKTTRPLLDKLHDLYNSGLECSYHLCFSTENLNLFVTARSF